LRRGQFDQEDNQTQNHDSQTQDQAGQMPQPGPVALCLF
jgi:hypothetical protein